MAVYISLSPKTSEPRSPNKLAKDLLGIGFTFNAAWVLDGDQLREIDLDGEPAYRVEMLDDQYNTIDIELSENFPCGSVVWWCMSWGCGVEAYGRMLLFLLDLGDRLDWETHGNSGKVVTRFNLAQEVAHFGCFATKVVGIIGSQSSSEPPVVKDLIMNDPMPDKNHIELPEDLD